MTVQMQCPIRSHLLPPKINLLFPKFSLYRQSRRLDNGQPPVRVFTPQTQDRLSLEWLLSRSQRDSHTPTIPATADGCNFNPERVLARLIQLEAHEPMIWERENYRQSFITLALALNGEPQPFVQASYRMYGVHPDRLFPAIKAYRKAKLGRDYDLFYGRPILKKPSRSTVADGKRERA